MTRVRLAQIELALHAYMAKHHTIPADGLAGLGSILNDPEIAEMFALDANSIDANRRLLDGYGKPIRFVREEDFATIVSAGPNGSFGDRDDYQRTIKLSGKRDASD